MDIALVADIEEKFVARRVEHAVQGEREFHDAEVRSEVAAGFGEDLDEFVANLLRELREGFGGEGLEVGGGLNRGQQRAGVFSTHQFASASKSSSDTSPRALRAMIWMRFSAASSFS